MYTDNSALQDECSVYLTTESPNNYLTTEYLSEDCLEQLYVDYQSTKEAITTPNYGVVLEIKQSLLGFSNRVINIISDITTDYSYASLGLLYDKDGMSFDKQLDIVSHKFEGAWTQTHEQPYLIGAAENSSLTAPAQYVGTSRRAGYIEFSPTQNITNLKIYKYTTNCYTTMWLLKKEGSSWVLVQKENRHCASANTIDITTQLIAGETYRLYAPYDNNGTLWTIEKLINPSTESIWSSWVYYRFFNLGTVLLDKLAYYSPWNIGTGLSLANRTVIDNLSGFTSGTKNTLYELQANIYDNKLQHEILSQLKGAERNTYPGWYQFQINTIPSGEVLELTIWHGKDYYGWGAFSLLSDTEQSRAYIFDMNNNLVTFSSAGYRSEWDYYNYKHIIGLDVYGDNFGTLPSGYYKVVIGSIYLTLEQAILRIDPEPVAREMFPIGASWRLTLNTAVVSSSHTLDYQGYYDPIVSPYDIQHAYEGSFTSIVNDLKYDKDGIVNSATNNLLWDILTIPQAVVDLTWEKLAQDMLILAVEYHKYTFESKASNISYNKFFFESVVLLTDLTILSYGDFSLDLLWDKWKIESITSRVVYAKHGSNELIFDMAYDMAGRLGGFITKSYIEETPVYPSYLDGNIALWDAPRLAILDGNSRVTSDIVDTTNKYSTYNSLRDIIPYDFRDVDTTSLVISHGPAEVEDLGIPYVNNQMLDLDKQYQVIDNLQILQVRPNYWVYTIRNSLVYGDILLKPGSLINDLEYLGNYNAETTFVLNFPYNRLFNLRSTSKPLIESLENQVGNFSYRNSNEIILESDLQVGLPFGAVIPSDLKHVAMVFTVLKGGDNIYFDGRAFYYFEVPPTVATEATPIALLLDLLGGDLTTSIALVASKYIPEKSYLEEVEVQVLNDTVLYHPAALINKPVPRVVKAISDTYVIPTTDNFNTITLVRSEYQLVGVIVIQGSNYWCKLTWVAVNTYRIDTYNPIDDLSKVSSIRLRVVAEFNKYI